MLAPCEGEHAQKNEYYLKKNIYSNKGEMIGLNAYMVIRD